MKARPSDSALKEASAWIARLQNADRSPEDEAAFAAWLAAARGNSAAFDHVTMVWDLAGGASGRREIAGPSRRRLMVGLGASAVVGAGVVGWSVAAAAETMRTSVGEQKRITTAEGVRVVLDTDSVLVIDRRAGQRVHARLHRGRAAFSLPVGGSEMFAVSTGGWVVAAIAADFDLCAQDLGAAVLVRTGAVVARNKAGQRISVDAACKLDLEHDERAPPPQSIDVELAQAWRSGQIVLDNTRLADAATSLNRYARKPIVVAPELTDFRVSGGYRTGAPEDFARSAAVLADARVEVLRNRIEILPK